MPDASDDFVAFPRSGLNESVLAYSTTALFASLSTSELNRPRSRRYCGSFGSVAPAPVLPLTLKLSPKPVVLSFTALRTFYAEKSSTTGDF